ncbi:MAG: hypothetical protein HY820_18860 [Acidobacteria bacterium]|nr:hypothetical protein [Acidobacteriota bacterium]
MASSSQVELVVTVEVDKANQSIKSVNANLSSIESTAAKSARGAAAGIDGMTAAMVKGATAGNLLADAIKTALHWVKEFTIEAVKDAAHVERLEMANVALAKAHGISAEAAKAASKAVQDLNFEDEVAIRTINRLIVADLGLEKAEGLAKLAKDAAVLDEKLSAPEALEGILRAIEMGNERALKQLGIKVQFDKQIELAELRLGRTLSENERVQLRYNAVVQAGSAIQGSAAAAAGTAEAQMSRLAQEIRDLRKEIGQQFVDEFLAIIKALREMVKWLGENIGLLEKLAQVALMVGGVLATYKIVTGIMAITKAVEGLTVAMAAGRLAMLGNPMALLVTGVAVSGAIIYKQYTDMQEQMENRFKEMERQALRQDLLSGKLKVEDLKKRGMQDQEIRELVLGRRMIPGIEDELPWTYEGPKLKIKGLGGQEDVDAEIARLKRAKETREFQTKSEQDALQSTAHARAKALPGFAGEVAELNAKIQKWTTMDDGKRVSLTAKAWHAVLDELSVKWEAFKQKLQKDNREALADYLKGEDEARQQRMQWEAELFQKRLQYNEEIARQNLDHVKDQLQVEQQRAGFERDARLRTLEAYDARTIEQKTWVEQQKAQIEIDYVEKVHEIKQRLFDLETSVRVVDYELEMKRLGYRADEIQRRIAEYTQQRDEIRQANQEATDAAVDAARQNAANRTAGIIRDHNQKIFDSLKQQAGGVFDALLTKSQSIWSAIGNSFKTALLTAIKDVVTSRVAAMLMQLFTGHKVSFASGGSGGGGLLSGIGGMLGVGAIPVFGSGGGGPIPGGSAGGWGTPPFVPTGGGGGGFGGWTGASSAGGLFSKAGWAGTLANLKSFFGIGGSVRLAPGVATTWQAATLGQKFSAIGKSNAALMGGALLALDGLRRGGWLGVGETTAGGALIGFKYGGPLGAAIGAGIGFAAGIVRLFVKGAQEKAREKIKATYGVDISDKGLLKQIVDTAKSAFGGNLDMAIRSPQIRDLIQLYAMTTGQKPTGMPGTMTPISLVQTGGGLFQATQYNNGTPLSGLAGLPSLDKVGGGAATNAGGTIVIPLSIDSQAVGNVVIQNGRVVTQGAITAMKSNAGRREMTALQLAPGTLVS